METRWPLVGLLLASGLFAAAQFGKLTLTLGPLAQIYGSGAPILVSIVGIVGVCLGAVAGGLVASIGARRALIGAMVLGGVVSLAQAPLPGFGAFLGLRLLEGVSHLVIVVAAPTLMVSVSAPHDRPVVMGIWATFFGVSLAITALILPWVLGAGGMRLLLGLHGAGLLVMAALATMRLPALPASGEAFPGYVAVHRRIYTSPRLLIPGLGFVWYTILYIALIGILPEAMDLPLWMISAMPLISLAGTFGAGILARRYSPPRIAMAGFVATGVIMVALPLQFHPLASVLGLMLVMGVIPGACFAAIPHFNTTLEARAFATGGIAQLGNVGTTLGTPIFSAVLIWGGVVWVSVCAVLFCILGICCLIGLEQRIRAEPK